MTASPPSPSGTPNDRPSIHVERSAGIQIGSGNQQIVNNYSSVSEPLDRAAEQLAMAVREQWELEAAVRSLHQPRPLRLRWSAPAKSYSNEASSASGVGIDDIVVEFRESPDRRVIVLGEPGSGKSTMALLLTLGLLAERALGDPVPVLLNVSSWDPRFTHLHTWITRRLEADYKAHTNHRVYGRNAALRLIRSGRVFPVLDGLDELPESVHATAIESINRALAASMALVVTCRRHEYETAVAVNETELSAATVIELAPVDVDDVITFLAEPAASVNRWKPVFEHLRRHSGGPLAVALSTPLMVHLARIAYRHPVTDPAQLIRLGRFDTAKSIERHLLDSFVPALYNEHPPAPDPADSSTVSLRYYPPAKVQRWLSFLASDVHQRGYEIATWDTARVDVCGQSNGSQWAHTWWALRGRLPWDLTVFLDDAHRRGVLRRIGRRYQFRHARLHDRLAGTPEASGRSRRETTMRAIAIPVLIVLVVLLVVAIVFLANLDITTVNRSPSA